MIVLQGAILDNLRNITNYLILTGRTKVRIHTLIVMFVACDTKILDCKARLLKISHSLKLLHWRWGSIDIDFITNLPKTETVFDWIAIFVDILSKLIYQVLLVVPMQRLTLLTHSFMILFDSTNFLLWLFWNEAQNFIQNLCPVDCTMWDSFENDRYLSLKNQWSHWSQEPQ